MPRVSIVRSSPVVRSPRVMQLEGLFDVQPSETSEERWADDIPFDEQEWNVGLIVGPSGCGKSTIARELFGDALFTGFEWSHDRSLVDDFPKDVSIKDITGVLSSVGFSSPPLWLRPYHVLSTGQKMRVDVARLLLQQPELAVMDEFTSVVDRTVAQIGSAAIAKTVRRKQQKFVAVSCHYDVIEWLQPDWVYEPHQRRYLRRTIERRPEIDLEIKRVHHGAWELFKQYHYLNRSHNNSARCFVAFYRGEPVAFLSMLPFPHPKAKNLYRVHRAVCLPDYQGVGIGSALITHLASAYNACGKRTRLVTSAPALNAGYQRDLRWKMTRGSGLVSAQGKSTKLKYKNSNDRLTTSWEYIGPVMDEREGRNLIYGQESSR